MTESNDRTAQIRLFGFAPAPARVRVIHRTMSWRLTRALGSLGLGLAAAPLLGLVPPHLPWALLALGAGIYFAVRYWREEYTVESFEGSCPQCDAEQELAPGTRLKRPHTLTCPGCRHDLLLEVEVDDRAAALVD